MSARPTASIIILTYNNLEYTRLCLESIYAFTQTADFELILVDNASSDETPPYLKNFAAGKPNVKLILNRENAGFARGNNQGAAAAEGDYLVLLNNDTVVTEGWLSGLIRHLQDPGVGMVGPVTNAAGNESRIRVDYQGLTGMQAFARRHTQLHAGATFEIRMLALFCAVLRRSVFEQVGPLDERFGYGMFEDDDYSLRLKEHGYRLLCAEDVFVHHWGSAGFSTNAFERYWRSFQENRQKFEDKWGLEWIPPRFRDELIDDQLSGMVKDKTWLANLVIERDRTINELLNRISLIETSSSYRLARLLWRLLARLAPPGSLQHRLGRSASGRLLRGLKSLARRSQSSPAQKAVALAPEAELRSAAEKQLEELLAENAGVRDIVVLTPSILWNVPLFQRPQQMALAFARCGCLTIFCEIPASTDFPAGFHKMAERLYIYARAPLDVLKRLPAPAVVALAYNQPDLVNFSEPRVVYEYIDELSVFPGNLIELQRSHDELVRSAAVVVATADVLHRRVQVVRPDAILGPNGVDAVFIRSVLDNTQAPPEDIAALVTRGPLIGYYGALARWFNFNLWVEAARARPGYQFLLIGPDYDGSVQEMERTHLENLHWLGPRSYAELPRYLKYFDVATIPFRLNEITHSTSPIKLFEYMLAEKPVVTTAMRECRKYPGVLVASNEADFINQLDRALSLRADLQYLQSLRQLAEANTWDLRAEQILQALKSRS